MAKKIVFGLPGVDRDVDAHKDALARGVAKMHKICHTVDYGQALTRFNSDTGFPKVLYIYGFCPDDEYDEAVVDEAYDVFASQFVFKEARLIHYVQTLDRLRGGGPQAYMSFDE